MASINLNHKSSPFRLNNINLVPIYQTFSISIILLCNSRTRKPASVILYLLFGSSYSNDPFSVGSFK